MERTESDQDIVEKVMSVVEEYYFGEGDASGEKEFNNFAMKHADKFDDDFNVD